MLNDITLGQYFPGNSPIHRMDPRMKLILTILYIVGVFIVANLPGYAIALAFLYIVVRISGIKFSYLAKGVKPLRFIIVFTFILNLFFVQGETPIFTLGFFTLTKEALNNAIYFALRLIFLVMGTSVLTLTTSPVQLTDGLERIMHPLEKIHFPAHELAMMMTIALRFIPTLLEETDKIQKAQMARGADFEGDDSAAGAAVRQFLPPRQRIGHGDGGALLPRRRQTHPSARTEIHKARPLRRARRGGVPRYHRGGGQAAWMS